ncbi:hypothetical protein AMK19_19020 [Kitasatospora sp. CB01950]|nr:hypothetical protein AMK19_19020 [Kitasatospora sp. CB01950]
MGGWGGPLPDDVRCLPHVAGGGYVHFPPAPDVTEGGENSMVVYVTPETVPEQTLALCLRITELGYGLDGPHQVATLVVGLEAKTGQYGSMPGNTPCTKVR